MTPKWQHIWWAVRHHPRTGFALLWVEIHTSLEPAWYSRRALARTFRVRRG